MKSMTALGGLISLLLFPACDQHGPSPAQIEVTTVPSVVYTVTEGIVKQSGAGSDTQDLSWLFHIVFTSREEFPLRFDEAHVSFQQGDDVIWHEALTRRYLEGMEWMEGAYRLDTDYFLDNVMFGKEVTTTPDLPAGGTVTWIRVPFARPSFARVDRIDFSFHLRDPQGTLRTAEHSIPVTNPSQQAKLRLPFSGTWAVLKGNDVDSGHRTTGFRNLTTMGWDFAQLDGDSFNEPVLAAGAGVVVDLRNDIEDYGRGEKNDGEWLEAEGVPSLFSDFERVIPGMAPENIALGNPRTGWLVRPREKTPQPTS